MATRLKLVYEERPSGEQVPCHNCGAPPPTVSNLLIDNADWRHADPDKLAALQTLMERLQPLCKACLETLVRAIAVEPTVVDIDATMRRFAYARNRLE